MKLQLKPNISDPDRFYEALIDAQRGVSEERVQLMNAKLILILANHIGDQDVLNEAIATAGGKI